MMTRKEKIYSVVSLFFLLGSIVVLSSIDKTNNIKVSLTIQGLLIAYLIKMIYGCALYIKRQYKLHKYSYSIIMNLGLLIFLAINLFRQINLLIKDWHLTSINDLYVNTLNSFSYFAYFILPIIILLVGYCIIGNIILLIKEGFSAKNLLGIFFGICVALGAFATQYVYEFAKNIELLNSAIYIKKFIDIGLNVILCYFYCLTLATLYCNIMAGRHKPDYDKDFVIILGAKVGENGELLPLLRKRVDKAIEFAKQQKENSNKKIIFVPSGGKGADEVISEAEAMKNYLLENGIKSEDIIVENQSSNTLQNMQFSKKKIDDVSKNAKIIFSTTNYHVFRSGVIANNEGIDCEGIGSNTKWYFYINAILREFVANLVSERKKHLALITSINIVMIGLVLVGHFYKLI